MATLEQIHVSFSLQIANILLFALINLLNRFSILVILTKTTRSVLGLRLLRLLRFLVCFTGDERYIPGNEHECDDCKDPAQEISEDNRIGLDRCESIGGEDRFEELPGHIWSETRVKSRSRWSYNW